MGLWSVKLICFYHLSWSRGPTAGSSCCPSLRFPLSLQSGVENYFQLRLSGSTDVCNVFHLLFIISFHILSGPALKKCYLADVSVCFWLLWARFKRLFLPFYLFIYVFFISGLSAKRESSRLLQYKPSVPHALTAQTYLNGKNSVCSAVLWYLKQTSVFYKHLWVCLGRKGFW